ncbi:MAG TPA: alpha-galactosidase [Candidatus Hydrogenedentes bacterium]|nr:alpha-galactosidase [Candidatus Hydrogenedentota bacterium]HPG67442.1 alpha-galactosidase [Candidatus Hydrogenedentota bacterium]
MNAACIVGALVLAAASADGKVDWLVTRVETPASVEQPSARELVLTNGLVRRTFRIVPNAATIDYENLSAGVSVLRGVKPEAIIEIDGTRFEVGGLNGQPDYAYLDPAWLDAMTSAPDAFQFIGYEAGTPEARYAWQPKRHAPETPWPPKGISLRLDFAPPERASQYAGIVVSVHYELYEGMPVLCKWVTVRNGSARAVIVNTLETEILAVTEHQKDRLHVESDYAFCGVNTTHWGPDAEYLTQVDYTYQSPVLMTSTYPLGPGVEIAPGGAFASFRTYELLHDSDDRERRGLARRRMMRALAPQATENPILMHVRNSDSESIRRAVDQCAEVGFEMIIVTFWSGFDIESEDPEYIARIKADAEYAHAKGVELGGYTLTCASRDVGPENNCINPDTGEPGSKFGQSACLASAWSDGYFDRVFRFVDATALDVIETDGPYHGDVCASTAHAHHRGLEDSQVAQWRRYAEFCRECRARGVYIHSPDNYYLCGSNKCAMGYRETNWSLPRERQTLIARQNIYDGTFEKTPSMGWMFVPLVEYHGGGAEATLEPLSEHLDAYEWHLANNFGAGVQACYRGPRLYDTDETKALVKKWVDFYKRHRAILDSDIIHVRRADGRRADGLLHVNPWLDEKGLAMVYNPTPEAVSTDLELPLYYTGLAESAQIAERDSAPTTYALDREYRVRVPLEMAPKSITWFTIK